MKQNISVITCLFIMMLISGCLHATFYEGAYRGKVIDADTSKPLEGVVIVGVWFRGYMGAGGVVHEFYDTRETVTDKNGDFSISGMGARMMTNIDFMDIVIFKAGYEHLGLGPWSSFKTDPILKRRIEWEGDAAIIPLKKWTLEQRRCRFGNYRLPLVPDNKKRLLLNEIENEEIEIR